MGKMFIILIALIILFSGFVVISRRFNFLDLAVKTKNPIFCNLIFYGISYGDYSTSAAESRYFCKASYGGRIKDIGYCNSLDDFVKFGGTISQKQACIKELSRNASDIKECSNIPIDKAICYTDVAINVNSVEICNQITGGEYEEGMRLQCIEQIARKSK